LNKPAYNTAALGYFLTGLLLAVLSFPAAAADSNEDVFDIKAAPIDDSPRAREIIYPSWFKTSFLDLGSDLDDAVKSGKKGIILYFGQKNCAYCQALMERDFGQKDIAEYTRRNFDVDLQGEEMTEHDLSILEQTNFTPSLLFYDSEGKLALKMRGYYPPYKFRAALEYVVDGHYKNERYRDYLLRADPPPKFEIGDLNERAFFMKPPYALDRSHIPANRPLVVFFEQRECHACDVLHSDALEEPDVLLLLSQMDAVQLDMWSDTHVITPSGQKLTAEAWANELGLFYAPTLVFFDELGQEVFRVDSVVRLHRLRQVLDYVLTKAYRDTDYQTWAREQRATSQQP
jgi:thioredoxin-related protein